MRWGIAPKFVQMEKNVKFWGRVGVGGGGWWMTPGPDEGRMRVGSSGPHPDVILIRMRPHPPPSSGRRKEHERHTGPLWVAVARAVGGWESVVE